MSAGQRRAGSQSAHPDDSIRIQACSEWRPRILSTLRVVRMAPPRRAGPLPRPSKRYNRSSISREIPAPLVRVAPRCLARIRKVAVNSCLPERNLLQILPIFHQSSEGIVLFAIWKRFLSFSCLNLPPLASNGNATFL